MTLHIPVWAKNLVEITLSRTVSKINAIPHFMQQLKMAAKYGGRMTFTITQHMIPLEPPGPKIWPKSLYLASF